MTASPPNGTASDASGPDDVPPKPRRTTRAKTTVVKTVKAARTTKAPAKPAAKAAAAATATATARPRTARKAAAAEVAVAPPSVAGDARAIPGDFVTDTEHPVLPIPFSAAFSGATLQGTGISLAAAYVAAPGPIGDWVGKRGMAGLQFAFQGFAITLSAEVTVTGSRKSGELTLQFLDPLGAHLPQLRHILNSHIAGDIVSLGGFLSYAGPTSPKAGGKGSDSINLAQRIRSLAVAGLSFALLLTAAGFLINRSSQVTEPRPIFVERDARDMRATTAGQISYLNPEAQMGEVVFSINSNTGDVLNFQLPCSCKVETAPGVDVGSTVLPEDLVLSAYSGDTGVRLRTQISIEGLSRAMGGDQAFLDLEDGRSLPVKVEVTAQTTAAMDRGELVAPINLVVPDGSLGQDDIGMAGHLRLATPWLPSLPFLSGENA